MAVRLIKPGGARRIVEPGGAERITEPEGAARSLALGTGLRTVYVAKTGNDSNDGLSLGQAKLTIQGGLNILQAGDVMRVQDGLYNERPSVSGLAGTVANPIWIAAETPGGVIVSDEWPEALAGTQVWTPIGGGIYSATHADVYAGHHNGDFLLSYRSLADLQANSVVGVDKPFHGLAFEGGTVYVRLRNNVDPNGEEIHITETFARTIFDFNNCDNVILDGFQILGAGNTDAVDFDATCANPSVINCVFDLDRFAVRAQSDAIVDFCEYRYTGFGAWAVEVNNLNPSDFNPFFDIIKDYFASGGNAFLEGSLVLPPFGSTGTGLEIKRNYVHDVFDGVRLGEYSSSEAYANVWERICDNAVQLESDASAAFGADLLFHNNRILDNLGPPFSHTGSGMNGDQYVFRNLVEVSNINDYHTRNMLKTIALAPNLIGHHFHNFYRVATPSPDERFIWYDFSNGNAQTIENFRNNIILTEADVPSGSGGNPVNRVANCYAGPSANTTVQGTGGVFAGVGLASLQVNSNFTLQAGSPARNLGQALPAGLEAVDVVWNQTSLVSASNDDAGPFPFGFDPGANWPRPASTAYSDEVPERWTSPGA